MSSILMIPREIPSYLKVAYSLRYKDEPNEGSCIVRVWQAVKRFFALVKELLYYRPIEADFANTKIKLEVDFTKMTENVGANTKPICVYFVSAYDNNGAILGNPLYYYHHYKIQNLQEHFAVAPKLVSSQDEMKTFMQEIKKQHPNREIQFVDIVSHGSKSSLAIHGPEQEPIQANEIHDDLFAECAPDATILLDACMTGLGDRNIADQIARKTPGRTVLAPAPSLYFSKPIIKKGKVVSAVHGFAVLNAYTCKSFSYPQKTENRYPYGTDQTMFQDFMSIVNTPVLQNAKLDRYISDEDVTHREQVISVFDNFSAETKALILKEDSEDTFRQNPLSFRPAFRSVLKELFHEARDLPGIGCIKVQLAWLNCVQSIYSCCC